MPNGVNYVRKFLKFSESLAVKYATHIITDNKGIQDYVEKEYGKKSALIEYGGDHVICDTNDMEEEILGKYSCLKMDIRWHCVGLNRKIMWK